MIFKISWTKRGLEDLDKLEKNISQRILKKINNLKENFNSAEIKRLQNSDLFRLRIGDYRVLFDITNDLIIILKIGNRKNIYKR